MRKETSYEWVFNHNGNGKWLRLATKCPRYSSKYYEGKRV
jgi:hypothetical protein|tara:strand:- start:523 stop:642 length:120 start_codon:yes stop_codon:yes gene_type:complete